MRKSSRSHKVSSKRAVRTNAGKVGHAAKSVQAARQPASQKLNKQAKLLDLLKRPTGATLATLSEASGWQQHSVRGFLAGVVRKKFGLELVSVVEADQRVYRIVTAMPERTA